MIFKIWNPFDGVLKLWATCPVISPWFYSNQFTSNEFFRLLFALVFEHQFLLMYHL
jgi:hypothetical protein